MSLSPVAYDTSNIFAQIMRGELPCHKVHEDDHTFVFMDIMPRANGHTLVLPKVPSRNILDAKPDDVTSLFQMAQKVAQAAKVAFEADGITLQQFSESAGGQVIFHTHVHILPRHNGVELLPPGIRGDDEKLAQNAKILREAISRLG